MSDQCGTLDVRVESDEEISRCLMARGFGDVVIDTVEIAARAIRDDQRLCRNRASPRATISAVSSSALA